MYQYQLNWFDKADIQDESSILVFFILNQCTFSAPKKFDYYYNLLIDEC